MRIAALLAVSTLLAINTIPTGAYAMFNPGASNTVVCRGTNCGDGGGGSDTNCAAICGAPHVAKTDPYLDCTEDLAHLPRITKGDIAMIGGGQRLHIAPVCQGYADVSLTEKQHNYLDRGNTPGLETAIAANPAIMAELTSHHYKADDVRGILIGSNAAVLYVHKM